MDSETHQTGGSYPPQRHHQETTVDDAVWFFKWRTSASNGTARCSSSAAAARLDPLSNYRQGSPKSVANYFERKRVFEAAHPGEAFVGSHEGLSGEAIFSSTLYAFRRAASLMTSISQTGDAYFTHCSEG